MGIVFNHAKLEERILAMYGSMDAFGMSMGMSGQKINNRLNGKKEFTMTEIEKAAELLIILPDKIPAYFFTLAEQGGDE